MCQFFHNSIQNCKKKLKKCLVSAKILSIQTKYPFNSAMTSARSSSASSVAMTQCCSTHSALSAKSIPSETYNEIKDGLRKSVPAAIVLWAFHKLPSSQGLSSRRVIGFLKKHYKLANDPRKTGKKLGAMLKYAVEFGLLEKRGNKYFLGPNH